MFIKHPKTSHRCFLLALLGWLLILAACGTATTPTSTPLESITVKLHWKHGAQYLGFYAAQDLNFYATEGLSVTLEPLADTSEQGGALNRVAAGDFHFSVGASAATVELANVQVVAIATIFQQSPLAFFARTDSGIITPADLAGHSVAVKGGSWQRLLEGLLQREGLNLDDIQPIPAGFDLTPFLEGEVEVWGGYITDEAVRARQKGLELVTLPLYEYGLGSYANMVFTSKNTLETDPDLAVRFLRASLRGWEWAVDHPVEAVDLMLTRFPELASERDFHLDSFQASIPLVRPGGVPIGSLDCAMWVQELTSIDAAARQDYCNNQIMENILQAGMVNIDQ